MLRILKWLLIFNLVVAILLFLAWASVEFRQTEDFRESAPKTGRFVNVGDVDLFLQEAGPAGGPAILIMSGTFAWSETWRPTMEVLAREGFRVIAVDMPPFGYSGRPANEDFRRTAQAGRIVKLVEALGLNKVVLMGHSFGARATVTAAAELGPRLRGLIVVAGAVGWNAADPGPVSDQVPWPMRLIFSMTFTRNAFAAIFANPLLTRTGLEAFVADPATITGDILAVYQRPLNKKALTYDVGLWLQSFLGEADVGLANNTEKIWERIQAPTLLLWGDKDTTTPLWQGERIKSLLPQSKLVVLNGVGHLPQFEAPAEARKHLIESLKEWK